LLAADLGALLALFLFCGAAAGNDSFTSNHLELVRVQRGPGLNDVGMVAWHMTLKTPECQQGRQVRCTAGSVLASTCSRMHSSAKTGSSAVCQQHAWTAAVSLATNVTVCGLARACATDIR
jgi:hypothetical protein